MEDEIIGAASVLKSSSSVVSSNSAKSSSGSVKPSSSTTEVSSDSAKSSGDSAKSSSSTKVLSSSTDARKEESSTSGTLKDSRDGKTYKTVTIANQTWMAENLNYVTKGGNADDGDASWCFDNKSDNCKRYGRLYTWAAALNKAEINCGYGRSCDSSVVGSQGICPDGWHLPSVEDWKVLIEGVGGDAKSGTKLKSVSGWKEKGNGTDDFGFSVLPGGFRNSTGDFQNVGIDIYFWSSTEYDKVWAYYSYFSNTIDYMRLDKDKKDLGFPVRCLKDDVSGPDIRSSSSDSTKSSSDTVKSSSSVKSSSDTAKSSSSVKASSSSAKSSSSVKSSSSSAKSSSSVKSSSSAKSSSSKADFSVPCKSGTTVLDGGKIYMCMENVWFDMESGKPREDGKSSSSVASSSAVKSSSSVASSSSVVKSSSSTCEDGDSYYDKVRKETYTCFFGSWFDDNNKVCADCAPPSSSSTVPKWNFMGIDDSQLDSAANILTDLRDNQTYKTVPIGPQLWMAENLNFAYLQGSEDNDSTSWCYEDDAAMCDKYGRLYQWSAAIDSAGIFSSKAKGCGDDVKCEYDEPVRGVCPKDWHVATKSEYLALIDFTRMGAANAATKLKAESGWNSSGNGTDDYGFAVLPAGYRSFTGYSGNIPKFFYEGSWTHFWTSTAKKTYADYFEFTSASKEARLVDGGAKRQAFSVRCVYDKAIDYVDSSDLKFDFGTLNDTRDGKSYKTIKIGKQTWMAENLNYNYNEGSAKSMCYGNSPDSCAKYGRLYTWSAAVDSVSEFSYDAWHCGNGSLCYDANNPARRIQGVCPNGWHLPTRAEWDVLVAFAGDSAGVKLKAVYGGWPWIGSDRGTNEFGFSAFAGGEGTGSGNQTRGAGVNAYFWTSEDVVPKPQGTEITYMDEVSYKAYRYNFYSYWVRSEEQYKSWLSYVRCIKN